MPKKVACPLCQGKGWVEIDTEDVEEKFEKEIREAIKKIKENRGLLTYPLPQTKIEVV